MPTNRFHHLIVAGLVVTVSVFLVLAAQAGLSAAASDTSDASTSGALQGKVRIHLRGYMKGPQFAAFGRGRFTMSGAISDRGTFVDEFQGIHPPNEPHVRSLRGAKGTLQMMVSTNGCDAPSTTCVPSSPRWRVTKGTKAYTGLRGRGTQDGRYAFTGIDVTMIGTVRK
jgi:hypothetical protein